MTQLLIINRITPNRLYKLIIFQTHHITLRRILNTMYKLSFLSEVYKRRWELKPSSINKHLIKNWPIELNLLICLSHLVTSSWYEAAFWRQWEIRINHWNQMGIYLHGTFRHVLGRINYSRTWAFFYMPIKISLVLILIGADPFFFPLDFHERKLRFF